MSEQRPVLLIEDNEEDFEIFRIAYDELKIGNPLVRHATGEGGLDYVRKIPEDALRPKLILLDLNLVDMDGADVLRIIRSDGATARIPVVVFSTSNNPKDIERCYLGGANAYVPKPVDIERFYSLVKSLKEFWLDGNIVPGESYAKA